MARYHDIVQGRLTPEQLAKVKRLIEAGYSESEVVRLAIEQLQAEPRKDTIRGKCPALVGQAG
jgi:Arc/MetJ-type ribon-helix-helix transcriptional regulator